MKPMNLTAQFSFDGGWVSLDDENGNPQFLFSLMRSPKNISKDQIENVYNQMVNLINGNGGIKL